MFKHYIELCITSQSIIIRVSTVLYGVYFSTSDASATQSVSPSSEPSQSVASSVSSSLFQLASRKRKASKSEELDELIVRSLRGIEERHQESQFSI